MRHGAPDRYVVQNLFRSLKFHVVAGPDLRDVLSRYTGYTGRPPLPPPWAFGPWISSDIWRTGGEVRYAVTKFLEHGIPSSVIVFDSPWEFSYNDFLWNTTQWATAGTYEGVTYPGFASIGEMMTFLQRSGLKVVCWMTPFVNTSSNNEGVPGQNTGTSPNYAEGQANNYFVRSSPGGPPLVVPWWKGSGSPVDFTNPGARDWLKGQLEALVDGSKVTTAGASLEPAIGGFKTDDGETSNGSQTYIPLHASYFDGRTGVEMRNGYCLGYHETVASVLGPAGVLFARSGFSGTQRFPVGWAGDNEPNFGAGNGLQSVIVAGLSAALSGFSLWSHDIGGYQNSNFETNTADLFMRWTQFGALTPIMQLHRQVDPGNLRQYPWGYGATALANYVFWARFHTQLFPYLYTYAEEASQTGLPMIRPLVLLHQADPNTHPIRHTYLLGNELLVAPMNTANSTTRMVYLPAGTWYDYWTHAAHAGAQTVAWTDADPARFPLFLRGDAIVPLLEDVPQTLADANYVNNPAITTPTAGLRFLVSPGTGGSFTLYDGTVAQRSVSGGITRLALDSSARPVSFKVMAATAPAGVERNGIRLAARATLAEWESSASGWWHDPAAACLFIKFGHAGGNSEVRFGAGVSPHGVTDSWKQFHGVIEDDADDDGDGASNRAEYHGGTDPHDEASRFSVTAVAPAAGGFMLSWPGVEGISYRVGWKASLDAPAWLTLSPVHIGDGSIIHWTDDGTLTAPFPAAQRFYEISVF